MSILFCVGDLDFWRFTKGYYTVSQKNVPPLNSL